MMFRASETPIDTAMPAPGPANASATAAAPATALIFEVSSASTASAGDRPTAAPLIPLAPSPSTIAFTCARMTFSAQTPAPAKPTPASPPTAIATEAAITTAEIACAAVATSSTFWPDEMLVRVDSASISSGSAVPSGSAPMKLRATEIPSATPTPAVPPPATATAMAATTDEIADALVLVTETGPAALIVLSSKCALVLPVTELIETAPAPATAMPAVEPKPSASAAAAETTVIVARETTSSPVRMSRRTSYTVPSPPATVQLSPATSVETRIGSSRSQLALVAKFVAPRFRLEVSLPIHR